MAIRQIVVVSSGIGRPSRTSQLAAAVSDALMVRAAGPVQIHILELSQLAPLLLGHLERSQLPLDAQIALERHALVVDHSLRPLFCFFRAQAVPTALYATAADFEGDKIVDSELRTRIEVAALQALRLADTQQRPLVRREVSRMQHATTS